MQVERSIPRPSAWVSKFQPPGLFLFWGGEHTLHKRLEDGSPFSILHKNLVGTMIQLLKDLWPVLLPFTSLANVQPTSEYKLFVSKNISKQLYIAEGLACVFLLTKVITFSTDKRLYDLEDHLFCQVGSFREVTSHL